MARLGDYIEQIRGVSYKPTDLRDFQDENSVPLLRANNIQDGNLNLDDVIYVSKNKVAEKQYLKKGDILICTSSGSKELVGKAAYVKQDMPMSFGAFCKVVRPKTECKKYIGHFFQSPYYRRNISDLSAGANINNIRNEHIEDLEIQFPPLEEQRRIAATLDKVSDLIAKRRAQLDKLDLLVKARFVEMFYNTVEVKKWPTVMIADISVDMRTGPFGSALHHDEFVDKGVFVLGIDNAVENRFSYNRMRYITEEKYQQLKRYTVKPGDVIITIMGTVGRSAVIPDDMPKAINTKHLACLTIDREQALPDFICCAFQIHPGIREQLTGQAKGAIMDGLNLTIIKKLQFNLPPLSLQNEFVVFYKRVGRIKCRIDNSFDKLETLKKALMQQYFG